MNTVTLSKEIPCLVQLKVDQILKALIIYNS